MSFGEYSKDKLISFAATVEDNSQHPLAKAILEYARKRGIKILPSTDFQLIEGMGIQAAIQDIHVSLGNTKLMQESQIDISEVVFQADEFASQGKTPLLVAVDSQIAGIIAVADPIKKPAKKQS